jgi:hypothetical protein
LISELYSSNARVNDLIVTKINQQESETTFIVAKPNQTASTIAIHIIEDGGKFHCINAGVKYLISTGTTVIEIMTLGIRIMINQILIAI